MSWRAGWDDLTLHQRTVNILIIGTAYPLRGGIAHYIALLASALARRHNVQIITFKRQYPSLLFPGKTQEESGTDQHGPPAPQLVDSINPFNWIAVARTVRSLKPDLLIFKYWLPFFGPCFGTIAKFAKRGRHTKALIICDNVIPHERRPGDIAFTRYFFSQADYFIVQSTAVERELTEFWPRARYRKAAHPVYNIFGKPASKSEARVAIGQSSQRILLFFGYVRAYKGLNVLLEALAVVLTRLEVHLLIVGEFYDDDKKYRAQIASLNLQRHVTVHSDYVSNDLVGKYFSACDAVILPYLSATQSGIAQIAYNFDKPVIATDVGGLAEVVLDGQTGIIVPPNNPQALADAIVRFYAEQREEEFIARIVQEKRKYSWDAMVSTIEELADDAARGSTPPDE